MFLQFEQENLEDLFCFKFPGTPGVGKSTLCQQLSENNGLRWLEVGKLAKENNCFENFDEEYNCHVLNEDKVLTRLHAIYNNSDKHNFLGYRFDGRSNDRRWKRC